jgi:hypothetical protein
MPPTTPPMMPFAFEERPVAPPPPSAELREGVVVYVAKPVVEERTVAEVEVRDVMEPFSVTTTVMTCRLVVLATSAEVTVVLLVLLVFVLSLVFDVVSVDTGTSLVVELMLVVLVVTVVGVLLLVVVRVSVMVVAVVTTVLDTVAAVSSVVEVAAVPPTCRLWNMPSRMGFPGAMEADVDDARRAKRARVVEEAERCISSAACCLLGRPVVFAATRICSSRGRQFKAAPRRFPWASRTVPPMNCFACCVKKKKPEDGGRSAGAQKSGMKEGRL